MTVCARSAFNDALSVSESVWPSVTTEGASSLLPPFAPASSLGSDWSAAELRATGGRSDEWLSGSTGRFTRGNAVVPGQLPGPFGLARESFLAKPSVSRSRLAQTSARRNYSARKSARKPPADEACVTGRPESAPVPTGEIDAYGGLGYGHRCQATTRACGRPECARLSPTNLTCRAT